MSLRRSAEPGARAVALAVLEQIERSGGHSNTLLAALPESMDARDRSLATELVYGVLRNRTRLDRLVAAVSSRAPDRIEPPLLDILRLALYQIHYLTRVPRSAAVNEAVALARANAGEGAVRFVNGVLRAACRAADGSPALAIPRPSAGASKDRQVAWLEATYSCPAFLVRRFVDRYGLSQTEALLATCNRPAPVVLRPTRRGGSAEALSRSLAAQGIRTAPSPWLAEALRVVDGVAQQSELFAGGAFYIQDEASQLIAGMPGPIRSGERVLDLCAAPGGKFLAIAESMPASGGVLFAADRSLSRLRLLHANALRCGVSRFHSIVMDACRPAVSGRFERILLDAPCTGTGVIRRHPEIRWRRGPDDIDRLARRQAEALDAACGFLASGGRLVYAVCSLEPEEGPEQIAAVLVRRTDMVLVDARTTLPAAAAPLVDDSGCLRTLPQRDDIDGFFAAVLTRK